MSWQVLPGFRFQAREQTQRWISGPQVWGLYMYDPKEYDTASIGAGEGTELMDVGIVATSRPVEDYRQTSFSRACRNLIRWVPFR
jgi:hypothetical protein